ncbi:catalase [Eupransor demetentiae]|uniref:Catalase n=1 Tax=Eupransor demetentiae TaxID=3109584 RepID=A0ABP0ERS1_9LACO|nr:Catalase (KatE) [Lactobacillaceae bacterium LMG 33000]
MSDRKLTTRSGQPFANNEHSLTAGERGPVLLQDYQLIEKLAHFDRERIPERVVHAKGSGAMGHFTLTKDMSAYTKADFLNGEGKVTDTFARFSSVAGEKGYPDTARDVHGFALRFYTNDGNYDIVGNNTPVFFINDPLKFPDFIHSQKREPQTGLRSDDMQWDFWANSPESLHQVTILFSDRGFPYGYPYMEGYGSHTYKWVNAKGEQFWVKYHFKTNHGVKNLSPEDATAMMAKDPDWHRHQMFDAIEEGDFPSWTMYVQIIPYEEGLNYKYDIFDVTKVVSQKDYPLIEVGQFVLDHNPGNFFRDVEQAAMSPANLVPGIEASPDKLLQGRLFSYNDTQRYRLGANYQDIPVNRPKKGVNVDTYERDGYMTTNDNGGDSVVYEPNTQGGPVEDHRGDIAGDEVSGKTGAYPAYDQDYTSQPGALYRIMSEEQKEILTQGIADSLGHVKSEENQKKEIALMKQADPDYGKRVEDKIAAIKAAEKK